ncbi:polysaccharide deacetylase family protein [Streptococcus pseudoporcinus]|uniref:Polysaccharide deacetylase n=1 Tax=Streptococcus pseudoporcinus TaxID=361101 RepID=A0A4U9XJ66_9STRE|nr:polysaccharide deacetylase family protein [Streptococcus pseudoporcinus]VTS12812.1 polysaccharide deacetylase [Streptococcus pseudoporcinus]VUC65701.1 polysaccharide deacetylase [Streptococcus pseudoporcinus]VUC96622.1 polysaccharide deacetylase [Streptococcus pseudoporcinus]VUC97014.1 polysaccharide deacetylase [Streptococcus pseudoporcinus]
MKKIPYFIIAFFLVIGLGIATYVYHDKQMQKQIANIVETERQVDGSEIKSTKVLKEGNKQFYYLAPLKDNSAFYKENLPLSFYQNLSDKKEIIFIKPEFKETPLENVKKVFIHQITYEKGLFKITKKSDRVISSYHLKSDYSQFKVTDLVNGHIDRIAQEIKKLDPDTVFDPSIMGNLSEQKKGKLTDSLLISEKGIIVQDKKLIPFQNVFDVINPHYLKGQIKKDYEDYLKKKKEEAKAKASKEKMVALTFDDGPNPATTPKVLELLGKYGAKATFFMMGSKIAGNEALVKKVHDLGNDIGNHSWDHPNLTKLSPDQVKSQIQSTNDAIVKACGQKPVYLRPPYGATNDMVKQASGMSQMLWTVDTRDWENHSTEGIMSNIKSQLQPGGVILMHDIHQTSVDALPTVLEYLKKEGYQCVTLSQLMGE